MVHKVAVVKNRRETGGLDITTPAAGLDAWEGWWSAERIDKTRAQKSRYKINSVAFAPSPREDPADAAAKRSRQPSPGYTSKQRRETPNN